MGYLKQEIGACDPGNYNVKSGLPAGQVLVVGGEPGAIGDEEEPEDVDD